MPQRLFWFFRVAIVFLFVATQPIGAHIPFPPDLASDAVYDPDLMPPASHSVFDQVPLNSSNTAAFPALPEGSFTDLRTLDAGPLSSQDPPPVILYSNFNIGGVQGGGTPAQFTLTSNAMVMSITNYHYGWACPPWSNHFSAGF
jgi:hypothetical protein